MNRLQTLEASSEFCVTLNHTDAIDPDKVIRTIPYAHPVYTAQGQAAQQRHHEISGQNRTHYCGAYWGWGFHEDGVKSGERVAPRPGSAAAVSRSAIYEGHIRHRRFAVRNHAFRYRIAMAYIDLDELPTLLGGRLTRERPGLIRFRRSDYLGDPQHTARRRRPHARRAGRRAPARGPDPAAHPPPQLRPLLQPRHLLLLLRARRRHARGGRRRGHQHPVGRAARLRAARQRRHGQGAARLAVHADGPALHVPRARARRDAVRAHREPPGRAPRVRRHARA